MNGPCDSYQWTAEGKCAACGYDCRVHPTPNARFDSLINRELPRDVWALWVRASLALSMQDVIDLGMLKPVEVKS